MRTTPSSAQIPVDMAPGQTIQLSYIDTSTRTFPVSVSAIDVSTPFTFIGFENPTLGGRVFPDTCKTKLNDMIPGQTTVAWFAQGFGAIAVENQDARGATVKDSRIALVTILANP